MKAKTLIKKIDKATASMKEVGTNSTHYWLCYLLLSLLDDKEIKESPKIFEHLPKNI